MKFSILVLSSPLAGQGARNAAAFAHELIAQGHQLQRVFFLDDGTFVGGALPVFPQDEADRLLPWVQLAEQHKVELALCISSALRRGLLDEAEAERHEKPASSVHDSFTIAGLGQLVDACAKSDRLETYGG